MAQIISGKDIKEVYAELLKHLVVGGNKEDNTYELQNVILEVEDNTQYLACRNLSVPYLLGELTWYWSGSNDMNFISHFAKRWRDISDDGVTSNSAYGYIINNRFGFNQLKQIIDLLQHDPQSRKAVINISYPTSDLARTKDKQCTVALQFLVRRGKLNLTVMMRSNDVYFGLPYDYLYFVSLMHFVAEKLNVKLGSYTHHAVSMHLYDMHFEIIKKEIESPEHAEIPNFIDDYIRNNVAHLVKSRLIAKSDKNPNFSMKANIHQTIIQVLEDQLESKKNETYNEWLRQLVHCEVYQNPDGQLWMNSSLSEEELVHLLYSSCLWLQEKTLAERKILLIDLTLKLNEHFSNITMRKLPECMSSHHFLKIVKELSLLDLTKKQILDLLLTVGQNGEHDFEAVLKEYKQ